MQPIVIETIFSLKQCQDVEYKLFDVLPSSKHLQKLLHSNPCILSNLPPHLMVPKCTHLLKNRSISEYAKSAVSKALSHFIEGNAAKLSHEVVVALVSCLRAEDGATKEGAINLMKYSECWRKALLYGSLCNHDDYASFLGAISIEMFKDPANSTIFALFAAMVGDGLESKDSSLQASSKTSKSRIKTSTMALLRLCLAELNKSQELKDQKEDIFIKLSPLLLLRWIPMLQYDMLHDDKESQSLLMILSDIIAFKLRIEHNAIMCMVTTMEERKLLAELASRCFPFSNLTQNSMPSCFTRYCEPVLSSTMRKIDESLMTSKDWKKAKLSLYICCHTVQLRARSLDKEDFESIAYFAIRILRVGVNNDNELVELQTGCIDFLASCIESMCSTRSYDQTVSAKTLVPGRGDSIPQTVSLERVHFGTKVTIPS